MSSGERILRLTEGLRLTGLSRSTLYRMVKAGTFPPSVQLGERAVGWREAAVRHWLESCPMTVMPRPATRTPLSSSDAGRR